MSRSYSGIRPKLDRVYSAEQVLVLYGVCRNTLGNWVNSGLRPSAGSLPRIFCGAEIARFHADRRGIEAPLRCGQFKCLGCKARVFPELATVRFLSVSSAVGLALAKCPDCGAGISKIPNETDRDAFETCLESNTSLALIDEGKAQTPSCIGQERGDGFPVAASPNGRLLLDWQAWAARYDEKTVAAHLRAIRKFEVFCGHKPFSAVTPEDAATWREAITAGELGTAKAGKGKAGPLSRSTIQHQASHLRAFFTWLSKRPGFRHLSEMPDYFELPRRFTQRALPKPKGYPEIEEAQALLTTMPVATLKDRRARAIYACAYVCGLRANTLATLRLRHVDVEKRLVHHNGTELRAKNGKSFVVNWFPRTNAFQAVLLEWLEEVQRRGLRQDDALFPELADLAVAGRSEREPFPPMKSASAVTEAFAIACRNVPESYSPHSVRHTLAQLGDRTCRTSEERKAWSLNLGHTSEEITWTYYGKVTDTRRSEIFDVFEQTQPASSPEMELMLAYHEHRLIRGTPVFEQA